MKRGLGVLIIGIMVGALVYGAIISAPLVLANGVDDNKAYEDFWRILNNEAYLLVSFNESLSSGNPNATLARKLIDNSREGELNSANISAQIWLALEELKKSGVKLYYSADELRRMAENISKNGLSRETVNELKAQGWTDEEITALEDYIAKNADNISGGFDMGSFLTNFSRAFVLVGFKYADYETWVLEKWKWSNPGKSESEIINTYKNAKKQIVPDLANPWSKFYHSYLSGDVNGMSSSLDSLVNGVDSLLLGSRWMTVSGGGIIVRDVAENGVVNNQLALYTKDYYWPTALEAYKQVRRVYVLVNAIKLGNNNPEVRAMLNREVAELKDSLVAYVKQGPFPQPSPSQSPMLPCLPGKCDVALSNSGETLPLTQSSTSQPTDIALNVNSNYGYIDGVQVTLEKSLRPDGHVEYKVRVEFSVERNQISDVSITLTTPDGTDSVHYSTLATGQHQWESKTFISSGTITSSGDSVVISGNIRITYVSTDSPTPNSAPVSPSSSSTSSVSTSGLREQEFTKSFYFRVTYDDFLQASNVRVYLTPQPSSVSAGGHVTFKLSVENGNNVSIRGYWRADLDLPDENGVVSTMHYSGNLMVGASSSSTATIATVSYPKAGDYRYSVTFYFGNNSKTVSGTVHVSASSGSSNDYRLWIGGVAPESAQLKEGDTVGFNVKIGNSYSSTQRALVKLYVDGELKDSKEVDVGTSGTSVTLHWVAQAGEHSYTVKLYRLVNGQELWEDSWSGSLKVARDPDGLYAWLDVAPNPVNVDGTVNVKVRVENHNSNECFYQGTIKVVDDSGLILWPKKDYSVAGPITYPCEIFEPDYTISGRVLTIGHDRTMVQNFTLEHVSKNMTLHLIIGGVEMASAKVDVVQPGPVIITMDCPNTVAIDDEAHCTVHLTLVKQKNITLHLKEIEFGGRKVWPVNLSSVWVEQEEIKLIPHYTHRLSFSINIDDALANYYFGKKPWDPIDRWVFEESFKDRFAGYSYLVRVEFDNGIGVSDTFEIVTPSDLKELAKTAERGKAVVSELIRGKKVPNDIRDVLALLKTPTKITTKTGAKTLGKAIWGPINLILGIADFHDWFFGPRPSDSDSNNIIGG